VGSGKEKFYISYMDTFGWALLINTEPREGAFSKEYSYGKRNYTKALEAAGKLVGDLNIEGKLPEDADLPENLLILKKRAR